MQIELDDVLALGDSVDKALVGYPAGVASLQSLKTPCVLRVQTEEQLDALGVRYLFNPVASEGVDLRAQTLLAERCGQHLFHGAGLFQDVVAGYVVSQLAQLPHGLSREDYGSPAFRITVPLEGDPMGHNLQAGRSGTGWRLQGTVPVVPYMQESSHVLLEAQVDGGNGYFLLPLDAEGVQQRHSQGVDGTPLTALQLQGVALAGDALLGRAELAQALQQGRRHATLLLCFEAVGLMQQLLHKTTEYLQIRKQFGQAIGSFQALQHRMVGVLLMLEQTRSAARIALEAMATGAADAPTRLAAAKYAVGVNGQKVAEECIQLHGGIGMTWELDVSHYAKRLVMLDHYFDNADQSLQQVMAAI